LGYYTIRCCWCRNCCLQLPRQNGKLSHIW
jgi:hypothetical protein